MLICTCAKVLFSESNKGTSTNTSCDIIRSLRTFFLIFKPSLIRSKASPLVGWAQHTLEFVEELVAFLLVSRLSKSCHFHILKVIDFQVRCFLFLFPYYYLPPISAKAFTVCNRKKWLNLVNLCLNPGQTLNSLKLIGYGRKCQVKLTTFRIDIST